MLLRTSLREWRHDWPGCLVQLTTFYPRAAKFTVRRTIPPPIARQAERRADRWRKLFQVLQRWASVTHASSWFQNSVCWRSCNVQKLTIIRKLLMSSESKWKCDGLIRYCQWKWRILRMATSSVTRQVERTSEQRKDVRSLVVLLKLINVRTCIRERFAVQAP